MRCVDHVFEGVRLGPRELRAGSCEPLPRSGQKLGSNGSNPKHTECLLCHKLMVYSLLFPSLTLR